jgi:AraC-like DNA-binding protein
MEVSEVFREVTPLSSEDCFVVIDRTKTKFTYPVHVHPEYELNFMENAKGGRRIVGDSVEIIDDLELCLIGNEHLEHGWVDLDNPDNPLHEITIQFHSDLFLQSLLNKKQFKSLSVMFENAKKGIAFSRPAILKVKDRLNALTTSKSGFYSVLDLIAILYELSLDEDARMLCNSTFTNGKDTSESRRVQKVLSYIQANYQNEIHLEVISKYIGMSKVSFCRFMKKRTGKNFVEYLNDYRLGIASRLLVNSNKTVAEITFECGFNNFSNFNRIFKKRKGSSPKEFRDNYSKMRKLV